MNPDAIFLAQWAQQYPTVAAALIKKLLDAPEGGCQIYLPFSAASGADRLRSLEATKAPDAEREVACRACVLEEAFLAAAGAVKAQSGRTPARVLEAFLVLALRRIRQRLVLKNPARPGRGPRAAARGSVRR